MSGTSTKAKSKELEFALEVVRAAGSVALEYFQKGVSASWKNDNTPVTEADKRCERMIREAIGQQFPHDSILGEEEGETVRSSSSNESSLASSSRSASSEGSEGTRSRRKWILDPIDGTYNFARQIPIFATLLALEEDDEIILGIVNAPALGETFWAEKGGGAFKNGNPISVSKIDKLEETHFLFGELDRITDSAWKTGFDQLVDKTYRQRGFADFLNFLYVFEGKAESALEVGVNPWDLAPMKILAQESGGCFSDLEGGSSIYSRNCLVSNQLIHQEILDIIVKSKK